jgi:hypothetical protein
MHPHPHTTHITLHTCPLAYHTHTYPHTEHTCAGLLLGASVVLYFFNYWFLQQLSMCLPARVCVRVCVCTRVCVSVYVCVRVCWKSTLAVIHKLAVRHEFPGTRSSSVNHQRRPLIHSICISGYAPKDQQPSTHLTLPPPHTNT